ncbi:MAG TPA: hypothetical protein VGM96_10655 [Reyranella sp.]|jgi:hypothetical protein
MADPTYQLVLQWPSAAVNLGRLIEIEDAVIDGLGDDVDDHDYGSGTANIFILTEDPRRAFRTAKDILERQSALQDLRAAFRRLDQDDFEVLWPPDLLDFKIV